MINVDVNYDARLGAQQDKGTASWKMEIKKVRGERVLEIEEIEESDIYIYIARVLVMKRGRDRETESARDSEREREREVEI